MLHTLFVVSSIVVQFDGSLTPPRDPLPGFTYSTNVIDSSSSRSNMLDGSEKLASCGAAIVCTHVTSEGRREEKLIAVDGRYLPNEPFMTSADTEYDGLLLGLDLLIDELSSMQSADNHDDGKYHILEDTTNLVIQGDCKAVIDQIKSKSIPRKMEVQYNLAMDKIDSIKELYTKRTTKILPVCLEHIPRENNTFCDAICKLIINQKQLDIVMAVMDLIRLGEIDAAKNMGVNDINGRHKQHMKKKRKRKNAIPSKSEYFQQALDNIRYNPQLCHSSRLALACKVTEVSMLHKDAAILDGLSSFFMNISRRWSKLYYAEDHSDAVGKDTLRKASAMCEKLSKYCTGQRDLKENDVIHYKDIDIIFQFCTSNKSKDNDDDTAVLYPYTNIANLIDSVDNEARRLNLLLWNKKMSEKTQH